MKEAQGYNSQVSLYVENDYWEESNTQTLLVKLQDSIF